MSALTSASHESLLRKFPERRAVSGAERLSETRVWAVQIN